MRLNRCVVTASWLALCAIAPIASAEDGGTSPSLKAPAAVEAAVAPKAPQLEKLAEKEAMKDVWAQLSPAQKTAAIEQAKKQLENEPPKSPRLTGNKEEDAIRGALKRIKQLPANQREDARRELRTCIDRIVPPPGTPQSQKPPVAAPSTVAAPVPVAPAPRRTVTIKPTAGCRLHNALAGCR